MTAAVSVPLHARLGAGDDPVLAQRLLTTERLRVAAWTGAAALPLVPLDLGARR